MASGKVRFLTKRPGKDGLPRYFWQPSTALRRAGHRIQRVPLDWGNYNDDADALEAAAIARAQELNRELDEDRARKAAEHMPGETARTIDNLIRLYRASEEFQR